MKKRPELSRDAALSGRPERIQPVRAEERPDGGLSVTLRLSQRRWTRWFTGSDEVERSYGLDPLGRRVYEACNGKTSVRAMVRDFAKAYSVSKAEAESAVTTFLKTLISRGLVIMAVDKDRLR